MSGGARFQPTKDSSKLLIIACCIIGLVILAAVAIPIFFIGSFWLGCNSSEHRLNKGLTVQTEGLDSLTILTGQKIHSKGSRSGDCLTGSIGASTTLPTTLTARQASAEVRQNLERQGFKIEYPLQTEETNDDFIYLLREDYVKHDLSQSITVSYDFTRKYSCAEVQQPCHYPNNPPAEALMQAQLESVSVGFSDYDY